MRRFVKRYPRRLWETLCLALAPFLFLSVQASPPNILIAVADDWGWPHAGAYGEQAIRTPTFDHLARQGVLFANAFVTAPSCTPSRGSILTGQWHWRLEENVNLWSTLRACYPTYPEILQAHGYFIGHWRKAWGPGRLQPGGRTQDPTGPAFKNFADFLKKRPKNRPFCFWFGSSDPHRPYRWKSGIRAGIDLNKIQVPPFLPDNEIVRIDIADYGFEVEQFDREVGQAIELLRQAGELDNTVIVVTGDNGFPFPRAKSNLYDAGTHVPLVIWFPKRFPGGRVVKDFVSLQDLAPTFLELAGLKPPAEMTGKSLLPILLSEKQGWIDPTRDHVLTGKERHVPAQEPGNLGGYPCRAIRTKDFLYIRNFMPQRWPAGVPGIAHRGKTFADCDNGPTKQFLVEHRNDPYIRVYFHLAFDKRPAEELYDLRNDPFEILNVAYDPRYAKVRAELSKRMMDELRATGDLRVLGGWERWEAYPYYGGPKKYWTTTNLPPEKIYQIQP